MMKWIVVLIFLYFRKEIECLNEDHSNKIIYTLCGCPFGYFEVSRFMLSSDTPPPNCTDKSPLRKSKRTLEGYQCHACHPSCLGCHGSTDGDCNQCANGYLRASSYVQQKLNNSHAVDGNGEEITVHDSQMNLNKREKRRAEEASFTEYKLDESESIVGDKDSGDDVLREFVRDVNEDNLLTLDSTKQEQRSTDGVGEYDLGSGYVEDSKTTALKGSLTTENLPIESISTPREIRSTQTIISNNETDSIEIFEKVIFTSLPPTIEPITKHSTIRKRTTTTTATTTTTQSTTPTTTKVTTLSTKSTTTSKPIVITTRTRKPKTRKTPKTAAPQVSTEAPEFSQLQDNFWCVSSCPEGSYGDETKRLCLPCDSKCLTCLGPSFMNCTACTSTSVRVSANRRLSRAMKNQKTITCLSNCPLNEFDSNGTCTSCHDFCNGCVQEGVAGCLKCKYSRNEEENTCSGPESDPLSALEIILPIVFVLILVIFTIVICLRWNGYLKVKKGNKMSFNYLSACRNSSTKGEPNSNPIGMNKDFILRKKANEYTTNPPFPKVFNTITEDGYELPLQSQPGPSGIASKDTPSNSSTMRSIKPRRNDPLPPTPLEMRAALHRKNSYLYDHYVNQPNPDTHPKENPVINLKNGTLPTKSERIYANC